jgi:hypothetical protein
MFFIRCALLILIIHSTLMAQSAGGQAKTDQAKDPTPEEIIRKFTAKETEFYEAWKHYTYHQTAEVRVLSFNGTPVNEKMTTISDIVFNDNGTRDIQILRRAGGLRSVTYSMEDEEIINNLQAFALTEKDLPQYDLIYEGKEQVDELNCYVFSVTPKAFKKGKLYFQGKIWVYDQDLQIVRTFGKPVPQTDERHPKFETIRQIIDKKYWFPVWTHGENTLKFENGNTARIEQTITYENYKRFGSDTHIQYKNPEQQSP